MTLLVSWLGVDTHGPTSMYMTSDSRITWAGRASFDFARKIFSFRNHPDLLGYCGDVLFPMMVLGQIREMADNGLLFNRDETCKGKFEAIKEKLIQIFQKYPAEVDGIASPLLQVIHASREFATAKFFCHLIEWRKGNGWHGREMVLPEKSSVLFALGCGAQEFNENYVRYQTGPNADTSRNVFHCFCDTLFNTQNPGCGGAPQLAGVIRKPMSPARDFGIIRERRRYLLGSEVTDLANFARMEWRNELFEICDGLTMRPIPAAQRQPDSLRRMAK